jgi:hypothetical protein
VGQEFVDPQSMELCDVSDIYTRYSYRTDYFTNKGPTIFPALKDPTLIHEKLIYLMPDLIIGTCTWKRPKQPPACKPKRQILSLYCLCNISQANN